MNPFDTQPQALGLRLATGFAKIAVALRHRAWQAGHPRDLTPTQGEVLVLLQQRPGVTLTEVGAVLGVKASTASEAVSTLERKGLLKKERSPEDRRALQLFLTPEGEAEAAAAALWPDFLALAVGELPEEEARVLMRTLQRMILSLQRRGKIPVSRMCFGCRFFRQHVHGQGPRPHHCAFVDAPFGEADLRFDCQDFVSATA
ncbi:MAG: winged helix-turn-helix transcriptional regulator [Acidobacteria bacterium]|nr:winged helix-turn-helix transcriptional regulator [Acidobacteriota bacterium]